MTILLDTDLGSLVSQIELEDRFTEEILWMGKILNSPFENGVSNITQTKGFDMEVYEKANGKSVIPIYLTRAWKEFLSRYQAEIVAMRQRISGLNDPHPPDNKVYGYNLYAWWFWLGLPVFESLLNAQGHGNKDKGRVPIKLEHNFGKKGLIYSVEDNGEGFNYRDYIGKLRRGEMTHWNFDDEYGHSGCGLRELERGHIQVVFNEKGNAVFIQYLFQT